VNESASLDHQAHVASSPNGWTDDATGLHWLEEIFDRYTKKKASNGLRKRLLYLDGHGSHLNMNFINWCDKNNILLAIYPPHSTHRLQPLDVALFSPLATAYTKQLEQLMQRSQNRTRVTKRDFLALFWTAFTSSFSQSNIRSAWKNTGLYPLDCQPVMLKLIKPQNDELARPCSNQSSGSSAISSSDWRKIRALLQEVTHEAEAKKVNKMEHTILTLTTQNTLLKTENEGLKQTIYAEKKRRKRGKGLFEQLRA
jgi:hypothetical protein